jgi:tetratricopeptide (TPR) repeat protein
MKKVFNVALTAAVAALLASTLPAFADDAAPPSNKPQVSIAAGKDLQAAQKALAAKRYDEVVGDLDKVKANPKKNEYDEYLMNLFYYTAYAGQKKYQQAVASLEAIMASKFMPPGELKQRLVQATLLEYQIPNYDKTIEYGNRVLKEGGNAQIETVVAQSYYLKNDFRDTDHFVRAMVDAQIKAGQGPSEEVLLMGQDATRKLNDDRGVSRWTELLVTYHPKPEYWQNLLHGIYGEKLTDRQTLQVHRLEVDVGALKRGSDYAEMAQLSLDVGASGEAVATLSKGFAANVFTVPADKNRNQHLLDSAKKQQAADQAALAKTEADANNDPTGDKLVGVGMGYFGNGDYAKAIKDLSAALAKGVSKDAADTRLSLGVAELRAGDKDAAVKTFKQIKDDPISERLATLWTLRARS